MTDCKFWCAFCISVITTFSITFRISVWWTCRRKWTRPSLSFALLLGSCLNAHASPNGHVPFVVQRMQSPLSELLLACSSPFSFCIAPSSLLLYVCNHLVFSHWNENLWFSARRVFGPSTSICNSCRSCRQMPSPERKCSTNISTLLTFQLASCTESPISCQ